MIKFEPLDITESVKDDVGVGVMWWVAAVGASVLFGVNLGWPTCFV